MDLNGYAKVCAFIKIHPNEIVEIGAFYQNPQFLNIISLSKYIQRIKFHYSLNMVFFYYGYIFSIK